MTIRIAAVIEYCQLAEDFFFLEIRSLRSITPFFCQNAPFSPKSNKTAPAAKPLLACMVISILRQ
jgi:hypothetical protein